MSQDSASSASAILIAAEGGQRGVQRGFVAEFAILDGIENNACLAMGRETPSGEGGDFTKVCG